jgi:hypothetical protein
MVMGRVDDISEVNASIFRVSSLKTEADYISETSAALPTSIQYKDLRAGPT